MCAILGIIFLGTIIALVVWAFPRIFPDLRRRSDAFAAARRQGDPAEEILQGRLARGEINVEEYEQALRLLKR
jgi:uncharacterized membrane protein